MKEKQINNLHAIIVPVYRRRVIFFASVWFMLSSPNGMNVSYFVITRLHVFYILTNMYPLNRQIRNFSNVVS